MSYLNIVMNSGKLFQFNSFLIKMKQFKASGFFFPRIFFALFHNLFSAGLTYTNWTTVMSLALFTRYSALDTWPCLVQEWSRESFLKIIGCFLNFLLLLSAVIKLQIWLFLFLNNYCSLKCSTWMVAFDKRIQSPCKGYRALYACKCV